MDYAQVCVKLFTIIHFITSISELIYRSIKGTATACCGKGAHGDVGGGGGGDEG